MKRKPHVSLADEKKLAWELYEQAKNAKPLDHFRISGAMSRVNCVDIKILESGQRELLGK